MGLADTRFENRRRKLASLLAGHRIDDMLVTHLTHVRYLSGFSGSNGALLISKDRSARITTDGRYATQVAEEVPDIEATITRKVATELLSVVVEGHRVGYEADYVSASQLEVLKQACPEGVTLVPVTQQIEGIRLVKDELELQRLAEAAELASTALRELVDAGELAAGQSERQVAANLEYRMRLLGADRPSFDTIVASGLNSAKPHHGASDRVIEDGDFVTIDFGMYRAGFNSDMTRTFAVGEPSAFLREIYEVTRESQQAGVEAAVAGAKLVDVDKACRSIIEDAGYGEYFVHSTGHGIGLDVHEGPYAALTGTGELEPSMTLTIEPGIYVPGKGGVRIEDTLIITSGAPRIITQFPKELIVL